MVVFILSSSRYLSLLSKTPHHQKGDHASGLKPSLDPSPLFFFFFFNFGNRDMVVSTVVNMIVNAMVILKIVRRCEYTLSLYFFLHMCSRVVCGVGVCESTFTCGEIGCHRFTDWAFLSLTPPFSMLSCHAMPPCTYPALPVPNCKIT